MKPRFSLRSFLVAAVMAGVACVAGPLVAAPEDAGAFPHVIAIELGATEFAPGDKIVITSVRGDRPHFEKGGRYLLEGTYTLASADAAQLNWSITSRGASGPIPITPEESAAVSRGSGTFRLIKTFLVDGWPHVTFYVNRRSHGSAYFGERGFENTILREKRWSDFDRSAGVSRITGVTASGLEASATRSANAAIIAYLGDPIAAPADLDARYSAEGLKNAFQQVSKRAGFTVRKLWVDTTEFPHIVYGVAAGERALRDVQSAIRGLAGYEYGGLVSEGTAHGTTYFALNLTPSDLYPRKDIQAIQRRLTIRMQMLASKAQESE